MNPPDADDRRATTWWYRDPADSFSEGLPIATGRLAGMVYGRPADERIPFDDETLWTGQPYDPHTPQAERGLEQVRELVREGDYREASQRAQKLFAPVRNVQDYQPTGSLRLRFDGHADVSEYRRELDLDSAVARVSYRHDGVAYDREVFASYPDQVIAVRLDCDEPGGLTFSARLDSLQPTAETAPDGDRDLVMTGGAGPEYDPHVARRVVQSHVEWAARLAVRADAGEVTTETGPADEPASARVRVEGADAATLVLAGRTNYDDWDWIDPTDAHREACRDDVAAAVARGYDELRDRHLDDWRPRFRSCRLSLGGESRAEADTTSRVEALRDADSTAADPHFVAQYFQYARYLLLCASRPGTLPFNNHNVWLDRDVDGLTPRWSGRWTLNVNLQECYWPADLTGLPETNEALLGFVESLSAAGERTAREVFDRPGWVSSLGTDVWMNTAPHHWDAGTIRGASWGVFPTSGAWLCHRLFEHYRFHPDDTDFLERLYPLLKGAARFFAAFLEEDPDTGWLVTYWSASPENTYYTPDGEEAALDAMAAVDAQILRDLFDHAVEASEVLDRDPEFRRELRAKRDRLPPHRVGDHGLQEWYEDWTEVDPGHRHLSHLYALHPSDQITRRDDPELADAVREALERREGHGGDDLGWSGAWRINLWARLGEADRAEAILSEMVADVGIHPDEDTSARVPSIDGNQGVQGLAAGVAQLLVQSHAGAIEVLPALPEAWPRGSVEGLRARGGYRVDVEWTDRELAEARVRASSDGVCRVRTGTPVRVVVEGEPVADTACAVDESSSEDVLVEFPVEQATTYVLAPE